MINMMQDFLNKHGWRSSERLKEVRDLVKESDEKRSKEHPNYVKETLETIKQQAYANTKR